MGFLLQDQGPWLGEGRCLEHILQSIQVLIPSSDRVHGSWCTTGRLVRDCCLPLFCALRISTAQVCGLDRYSRAIRTPWVSVRSTQKRARAHFRILRILTLGKSGHRSQSTDPPPHTCNSRPLLMVSEAPPCSSLFLPPPLSLVGIDFMRLK